jgi:hypothetical protein
MGNGSGCTGAIDRNLGELATVMARWDDAVGHFEAALDLNGRTGAKPFLARTQYAYARMLVVRGAGADRPRAEALLERARRTAQEIGMTWLAERALAARPARSKQTGRSVSPLDVPPEAVALFVREGEYWTVGFPGYVFRVRDALGLHCIALVLRHPGRRFLATELAASVGATATLPSEVVRRMRQTADPQLERARVNVTRNIRAAIARIARNDPALGRYLSATIRTGTSCVYTPDVRRPVAWKL